MDFETEHRTMLGGSDAASLLNEGWGCKRRLHYQKRGTPEDFPYSPAVFERGKVLEPVAAKMYKKATGRKLIRPRVVRRHKDHAYLAVHADRFIEHPQLQVPGPLEIKTMRREEFLRTKRGGLRPDYILQLQWAMMVTRFLWGSFAILWPDGWELLWFDVARDEELCQRLFEAGVEEWPRIENGPLPEPLPAKDPRCRACPFRITCRGAELAALEAQEVGEEGEMVRDSSLALLVAEYNERRAIVEEAQELFDETKGALKVGVGDRKRVDSGVGRVYSWQGRPGKRISPELVRQKHPEILPEVEVPSAGREFFRVFS